MIIFHFSIPKCIPIFSDNGLPSFESLCLHLTDMCTVVCGVLCGAYINFSNRLISYLASRVTQKKSQLIIPEGKICELSEQSLSMY